MSVYPIVLFIHVVGAVGVFAALAIELVSLRALRLADTPAETRVSIRSLPGRMAPLAMLATLASGIWMMATRWGREPWLFAAFVGLVTMAVADGAVSRPRVRRLRISLAAESGPRLSSDFRSALSSAALTTSLRLRVGLGIGILALMTLKPAEVLTASLIVAASVVAGLIPTNPFARHTPAVRAGIDRPTHAMTRDPSSP